MLAAAIILAGYLAGSIPTGYWLVRLFRGEDIRRYGSGNIGATNVWRAFGRKLGIPVVFLDVLKGFVPGLVGSLLVGSLTGVLAGAAAMAGHWRPLFLRFEKGGKTVATCGGVFFGVAPKVGLISLGCWIVVFLVFRYASLASIFAALALPVTSVLLGESWPVTVFGLGAAVAVILLHKGNIARLRKGTENRFQLRRRSVAAS